MLSNEAGSLAVPPVLLMNAIPWRLVTHETPSMINYFISEASTYTVVELTGISVVTAVTKFGMPTVSICPLIALARLSNHVLFCQDLLEREAISRILIGSLPTPIYTILNPAAAGLECGNAPLSMLISALVCGLFIVWLHGFRF